MLADHDAVAMIAVKELPAARRFYEGVLGLELVDAEEEEVLVFRSGGTIVNVYRSKYAGTNQATAVTWTVGDELEGMVNRLKAEGVRFEHYDLPGMTRDGDVHIGGKMKVAWFKDPDGNILSIVNGTRRAAARVGNRARRPAGMVPGAEGTPSGLGGPRAGPSGPGEPARRVGAEHVERGQ